MKGKRKCLRHKREDKEAILGMLLGWQNIHLACTKPLLTPSTAQAWVVLVHACTPGAE